MKLTPTTNGDQTKKVPIAAYSQCTAVLANAAGVAATISAAFKTVKLYTSAAGETSDKWKTYATGTSLSVANAAGQIFHIVNPSAASVDVTYSYAKAKGAQLVKAAVAVAFAFAALF